MSPGPEAKTVGATLIAVLLALTFPWAHAQGQDNGELGTLADELQRLRAEVAESNRANWALFIVSFAIGMAIAVAAVVGTVWNARQLRRHVGLVEADMATRLRPVLVWTADGDMPSHTFAVVTGSRIKIRIINAGQVAAVRIVCDIKVGMAGDFEAGEETRSIDKWGSLAPTKHIEIDLPLTDEQNFRVRRRREKFHIDIVAKYRAPYGQEYQYSMSGDYDGLNMILRD